MTDRTVYPPLAEPPEPEGGWAWIQPFVRPAFIRLNRFVMIPLHRAGLGAWLATPVMGYMLLLGVRGRKSGLVREIPLSYLVAEGSAWVLAGFGRSTEWYRNLLADPAVELRLPGRRLACTAEEVLDPAVRARMIPRLVRATGLPGTMVVPSPWTTPDEEILDAVPWVPLIRIRARNGSAIEAGADDPGGLGWVWRQAAVIAATFVSWRLVRRLLRRR